VGIKYHCRKCDKSYELDDESGGKRLKCISCASVMEIPVKNETSGADIKKSGKIAHSAQAAIVKVYSASGKNKTPDDIIFRCKLCNKKYRLSKDFAGIEAECAKCKKILIVPRHSDIPEESLQDKIVFRCQGCSQKYRLPKIYANQKAKCSRCHSFFIIPEQSEIAQPVSTQEKAPETRNEKDQNPSAEKLPGAQERITSPAPNVSGNRFLSAPQKNAKAQQDNRGDIGQSALMGRDSRTQTSVEITGDSAMAVKYVLVPPGRNILKAVLNALIR
jgi:phage FluMu protein Com